MNNDIISGDKEIIFWRRKYLKDRNYDDTYINYFLCLPSSRFIKKEPDEHMQDIQEYIDYIARKKELETDDTQVRNIAQAIRDSKEISGA